MKKIISAALSAAMIAGSAGAFAKEADAAADGRDYPPYYTQHTIDALEQGDVFTDEGEHTNRALFVTNMIHDNPSLAPFTSQYKDSAFLKARGFDAHVFGLDDCAQYALLWDEFDEAKGKTGHDKVFPIGSDAREWVEAKNRDLRRGFE